MGMPTMGAGRAAHFMLAVAKAGAMPLRTSRHCGEALSCVTRLVLWVALVSCGRPGSS